MSKSFHIPLSTWSWSSFFKVTIWFPKWRSLKPWKGHFWVQTWVTLKNLEVFKHILTTFLSLKFRAVFRHSGLGSLLGDLAFTRSSYRCQLEKHTFYLVGCCWLLLVVGCWLLVVGCWLLVVGCWLLVVGCWLLFVVVVVVGCLLLVVGVVVVVVAGGGGGGGAGAGAGADVWKCSVCS